MSAKTEKPADTAEYEDGADNLDDASAETEVAEAGAAEPGIDEDAQVAEGDSDFTLSEEPDGDSGERRWQRILLRAGIIVLFLAPVGLSGFLGWQLWQEHQIARASDEARQAAVSYAQVLTSIDANKVDENFNQVLDGSTGEFKDMYSKSSMQLRQLLIDNKATAHGVVQDSAIQSASKDKVVVLLFVDQAVSNMNMPDPRIDRSRMKMTMEHVDGRWLASKVELP